LLKLENRTNTIVDEQNDAFKPDLHGLPDGQQLGSV
jgi:hypothetical protein